VGYKRTPRTKRSRALATDQTRVNATPSQAPSCCQPAPGKRENALEGDREQKEEPTPKTQNQKKKKCNSRLRKLGEIMQLGWVCIRVLAKIEGGAKRGFKVFS